VKNTKPIQVSWCGGPNGCGWEGPTAPTCPKCHERLLDLGWRVGFIREQYRYYSTFDTIPRDLRTA